MGRSGWLTFSAVVLIIAAHYSEKTA